MKHTFFFSPDPDDSGDASSDDTDTESSTDSEPISEHDLSKDDSPDPSTEDDSSTSDDSSDTSNDQDTNDSGDASEDQSTTDTTNTSDTDTSDTSDDTQDTSSDAGNENDTSTSDTDTGDGSTDTTNQSTDDTSANTQSDAGSSDAGITAPVRPYGVESWRALVTQFAEDLPVEVLLRWIKHESGGNPCSTGKIVNNASIENGLFQLYSPDDDHFATPSQLHGNFCSGQTCTRNLTADEAKIQVTSGIAYVKTCRERTRKLLSQQSLTWDESGSDFWSMVKMQHNLPGIPAKYISILKPSSWADFKNGVIQKEPKYNGSSIFSNAEDIGSAI